MKNISQKIFCAFCRLERKVFVQKSIGWTNVLLSFLGATLLMFAIWKEFDPRVIVIFVLFAVVAEVFVRTRWRMGLLCPHCGFDPLLYKTNRAEAVKRVKAKLDDIRLSGRHLLRQNNPFLHLPKIEFDKDKHPRDIQASRSISREV
jgi:hypothetical protein